MDDIKKISKKYKIPDTFQNIEHWETKRRGFLKGLLVAGALSQVSLLQSCKETLEKGNEFLTSEQATILNSVLNIIWPDDGNGPNADEINVFQYIMWVLGDEINRYEEDNQYIIDGIDWTNEISNEIYFTDYIELEQNQKEALVNQIAKVAWGKQWCSALSSLTLESLLLDPIYGCQPDEVGWKWLGHTSGSPRANESTRYENLLETVKNSADGI